LDWGQTLSNFGESAGDNPIELAAISSGQGSPQPIDYFATMMDEGAPPPPPAGSKHEKVQVRF